MTTAEKITQKEVIANHKKLARRNPEVNNKIRHGLHNNLVYLAKKASFNVSIRKTF